VRVCPFDCSLCIDPLCRVEGCKQTGEVMFEMCNDCGELFIPINQMAICIGCIDCEE
jgi:uncharacterized OB-fold protein